MSGERTRGQTDEGYSVVADVFARSEMLGVLETFSSTNLDEPITFDRASSWLLADTRLQPPDASAIMIDRRQRHFPLTGWNP